MRLALPGDEYSSRVHDLQNFRPRGRIEIIRADPLPLRLGQKFHLGGGTCSGLGLESLPEFLEVKRFDLEFLQAHLR